MFDDLSRGVRREVEIKFFLGGCSGGFVNHIVGPQNEKLELRGCKVAYVGVDLWSEKTEIIVNL